MCWKSCLLILNTICLHILWDGRDRGNILCKEYGEYSIEFVQSAITFGAIPGRSSCAIPWVVELCNTKGGIVCNRIGSTERAASSAYHGIGAWGERRQLTSWPSRSTALLFYCLPPHLPTSQAADTRHYQALSAAQVLRNKMEPGFTCWPQSPALFSFALKLQNSSSRWFLFCSLG